MASGTRGGGLVGWTFTVFIALIGVPTAGQELSTDILPSEDELIEALRLGDIDADQYRTLYDLLLHGIDSTDLFLFDEIPNLWQIRGSLRDPEMGLESDQAAPFLSPESVSDLPWLRASYRLQQRLESSEQWSQRLTVRASPGMRCRGELIARRDLDGSSHLLSRSITLRAKSRTIEQITAGSFIERYGLGTVIGYRGRLLSEGSGTDGEAFLSPNNGRFNGLAFRGMIARMPIRTMLSASRDSAHTLVTSGSLVQIAQGVLSPTVVFGASRLGNRATGAAIADYKVGLFTTHRYQRGTICGEISGQAGEKGGFGAALLEGQHRVDRSRISYAVWCYETHYLDLTGGAKAGNLRHGMQLAEIDYELMSKRSGQKGMAVRSSIRPDKRTRFDCALTIAAFNKDTANGQFLGAWMRDLSRRVFLRCDYLADAKMRDGIDQLGDVTSHRVRTEIRWQRAALTIRSYLGLSLRQRQPGTACGFISARCRSARLGDWEVWSNLGKVVRSRVEYWYVYLQNQQTWRNGLIGSVKLSRSYSRDCQPASLWTVALTLKAAL